MAFTATDMKFIHIILRPLVDPKVDEYKDLGYTFEDAWSDWLTKKPVDATDEVESIMKDMFTNSWNEDR